MNTDLSGKNALVLGGSKGLGKAIAVELAALGADITLAARSPELMAEIVRSLPNTVHQRHSFLVADTNDLVDLEKKVRAVVLQKHIHILINNTGGPAGGPILSARGEDIAAALSSHLLANQLLVNLVVPGMKEAGFGRIINVVSTSVKEPIPGLGVSNTVRGAVASWAKTLSHELAPFGITVNNVLPGFTSTERLFTLIKTWAGLHGITEEEMTRQLMAQVPMGRFADPAELGAVAAFLATPAAGYVTGVSLAVDGGRMRSI